MLPSSKNERDVPSYVYQNLTNITQQTSEGTLLSINVANF